MMCNCHSYNWGIGFEPEIIMTHPLTKCNVCIDACIAYVVRHLWNNNIWTTYSCCGHNRENPSIGLWAIPPHDYQKKIYIDWVKSIIKLVDNREWFIF